MNAGHNAGRDDQMPKPDAELRALLAAITDVVLVLDSRGRYVKIAPSNPALLYRPAPELLGKTLHEVFPRAQADEFLAGVQRALATRSPVHLEYGLPIGGKELWFSASLSPMSSDQVVVVARDITQLKGAEAALRSDVSDRERAERKLRVSEERFRALVEHSSDVIVLLDLEGTVLYATQSTKPVLGYGPEENVGRNGFELVHPDDRPALERQFADLVTTPGHVVRAEFRAQHKDGSWRYVEGVGMNRLADHAVNAIVVNYRDIGERKRGEAQLKAALSVLTATLESTADGILVVDRGGHVTSHNSKFARMWRVPDEVLESRDEARLQRFVQEQLEDADGFLAKLQQLSQRPDAESFDLLRFRDGRCFERFSQPQRIGGEVVGRVFSFRDVTEQTHAERVQTATYEIAEATNTAPDLAALLRRIHEIIGELMPAQNLYIAIYDPVSGTLSFPYFVDEYDTVDAPRPLRKGLTEYVLRSGEPLLATPEVHAALERQGEVELIGAPSVDWLGVPLKVQDRTIGVLVAQSYTEGLRFGETEREILQFVSTQVALAIERRSAVEQLQMSEYKYRLLFESNPEPMWVHDLETLRFLAVNQAAINRYGYSRDEFLAMTIRDIRPATELGKLDDALKRAAGGGGTYAGFVHCRKDGTVLDVEVSIDNIEFEGRPARLVLARDVTARRHLEHQLRQSQKMEAVGRLAGGIAHDFNNLLTAILGYCQLLERQLVGQETLRKDVEEIRRAGERAASLTQQLLAFSRKQVLRATLVNVNAVIADIDKMLHRMIGEDVELVSVLRDGIAPVKADANQLEQIIVNLAINARDAMPNGGRLTIETANVELDDAYARQHLPVVPGRYVLIAVSDTGSGIDEETRVHLFEPFFTTKGVGRGTGLGLATVYGIVKQFGGYIWVYSEPGHGTTFKIYLPQAEGPVAAVSVVPQPQPRGGSETVLLVEDEDTVRALAQKVLQSQGYTVLEARAGSEALGVRARYAGPIDLLLTDVIMPGMSGRELAERLGPSDERMRVLYMSGYTDDAVLRHGVLEEGTAYIQKPFTPDALARRVRDVLDRA